MNLFSIVWDGLRRRKIRTTLSVLGIAIATTALFTLVSLREGYEAGMRAELESMGAQIVAVAKGCPYEAMAVIMIGGQVPATLPEDVVDRIRRVSNVASASPNVFGAYRYLNLSHPLVGITREELQLKRWWKIKGRFPENPGEVVLGNVEAAVFAEKSGEYKQIGDSLNVEVGGRKTGLKVVGILEATGSKDDYATFATLQTAQELFNLQGRVVSVNIRVKDINRLRRGDGRHTGPAGRPGRDRHPGAWDDPEPGENRSDDVARGDDDRPGHRGARHHEHDDDDHLRAHPGDRADEGDRRLPRTGVPAFPLRGDGDLPGRRPDRRCGGDDRHPDGRYDSQTVRFVMPTVSVGRISWQAVILAIVVPLAVGIVSALYPALRAARLDPIQALRNE